MKVINMFFFKKYFSLCASIYDKPYHFVSFLLFIFWKFDRFLLKKISWGKGSLIHQKVTKRKDFF